MRRENEMQLCVSNIALAAVFSTQYECKVKTGSVEADECLSAMTQDVCVGTCVCFRWDDLNPSWTRACDLAPKSL